MRKASRTSRRLSGTDTATRTSLLQLLGVDRSDIIFRPRSRREVDAFKEDMPTWADFAAFGFLIDRVGQYQLEEMLGSSYLPIEDVLPRILREEKGHVAYGEQQLPPPHGDVRGPRGGAARGRQVVRRRPRHVPDVELRAHGALSRVGLKRRTNDEARRQYIAEVDPLIEAMGLVLPDKYAGREYL